MAAIQKTFSFFDAPRESCRPSITEAPPVTESVPEKGPAASTSGPVEAVGPVEGGSRAERLRRLRAAIGETSAGPGPLPRGESFPRFSTGSAAIDGLLPQGGLRRGTITEWVGENAAGGVAALSLAVAAQRRRSPGLRDFPVTGERQGEGREGTAGALVVVDSGGQFYPPAAFALGIAASEIIWCRPRSKAETVWAIDQALRCPAVGDVWADVGDWLDDRDARRCQLAAEAGQTSGWLIRPATVRGKPSFAEVRFFVAIAKPDGQQGNVPKSPASAQRFRPVPEVPWWMDVTLDRVRGGSAGKTARVGIGRQGELRDETAALRLASRLAHPKSSPPARRRIGPDGRYAVVG